jgi:hypothetical protein
MLFELDKTDGVSYTWKLLPYGDYKQYLSSMKFRDNKFLFFGGLLWKYKKGVGGLEF